MFLIWWFWNLQKTALIMILQVDLILKCLQFDRLNIVGLMWAELEDAPDYMLYFSFMKSYTLTIQMLAAIPNVAFSNLIHAPQIQYSPSFELCSGFHCFLRETSGSLAARRFSVFISLSLMFLAAARSLVSVLCFQYYLWLSVSWLSSLWTWFTARQSSGSVCLSFSCLSYVCSVSLTWCCLLPASTQTAHNKPCTFIFYHLLHYFIKPMLWSFSVL